MEKDIIKLKIQKAIIHELYGKEMLDTGFYNTTINKIENEILKLMKKNDNKNLKQLSFRVNL